MKKKTSLSRLAVMAAAAMMAAMTFTSKIHAAPACNPDPNVGCTAQLNVPMYWPQIFFAGPGAIYDGQLLKLDVDVNAFAIQFGDGSTMPVSISGGTLKVRVRVNRDSNGKYILVGGIPSGSPDACGVADGSDELCIQGAVDVLGISNGVLLKGTVVDLANGPDSFGGEGVDFRIRIKDGMLAPFFPGMANGQVVAACPASCYLVVPVSTGFLGTAAITDAPVVAQLPPDTTPPQIQFDADGYQAPATGPDGAVVNIPVTATDDQPGLVALTCSPASGSLFHIGTTSVMCSATDAAGNLATPAVFPVTVFVAPPSLPGGACFVVDFREVTYFKDQSVITTWPYNPAGTPGTTKSRGTLYRIYGFQPGELGHLVPSADFSWISYAVKKDVDVQGYYIDLGGPARAAICANQLHNYVLAGNKGNGHMDGSTLLPISQRNVPGIMLTHNTQIVKLPTHVKTEMTLLGLNGFDPRDPRGVIDFIGFQQQGNGDAHYREFVNVEVQFLGDSETNRLQHYQSGFHTALNINFESFAGCSYVDSAPGNDGVRLRDVWGPNRSRVQGYANWQACGSKEPTVNQRQRENYIVPFNGIQILSSVNSGADTLSMFYGVIRPVPDKEKTKKDHKLDWADWDRWDR